MPTRTRERIKRVAEIKRQIGDEISRMVFGISQNKLCEITGLHQTEVSKVVNNNCEFFSLDKLVMIALALGCEVRFAIYKGGGDSKQSTPVNEYRVA